MDDIFNPWFSRKNIIKKTSEIFEPIIEYLDEQFGTPKIVVIGIPILILCIFNIIKHILHKNYNARFYIFILSFAVVLYAVISPYLHVL